MNIVLPIFDRVTQLDFTGPVQVLSRIPSAEVFIAAGTLEPVVTDCGFSVNPTVAFADCPTADLLCVPGGPGTADACRDTDLVAFVERQASTAKWVTSVCTGMFILGKAGLIKDKRVTSHWAYTNLIAECGGIYEPGRLVVDGNMVTGGGVTAGLDFALKIVSLLANDEEAQKIQLTLEYDPQPPFDAGNPDSAPDSVRESLRDLFEISVADLLDALNE